ncbi:uroporphyrinogen-III C-methyltransferase, partial [Burkholderia pseudomallei]|nr:uroporphyrinogen-III C-methyltransferase [Burkholderia pseudomallei]
MTPRAASAAPAGPCARSGSIRMGKVYLIGAAPGAAD